MEFRTYRPSDYEAVCDFLIALNRDDRRHINWNWARFEWMYEHPECDRSLLSSVGLWEDGGKVVGAAIYDMYFGEAFCAVLPEYRDLYPQVLDYAWRTLRDENGLGIAVCDGSEAELAQLKAAGFVPAEQTETVMAADLARLTDAALPEGFRLRELDHNTEGPAVEWVIWQGFDHGSDRAEFEGSVRSKRVRPHFDRRLSLAAADAAGEPVCYCCLWYRPDTDYAYVEPVCTVPAFRGRGLAGALVTTALLRARALGARTAYVISDLEFYEKIGFEKTLHYTFHWKT